MNIFKVLASGKKSFQEETASAILAWFMNPTMEHGLGYAFISKFIAELANSTNNRELSDLATRLTPRLRGEYENLYKLWFNLEYNVDRALIDIVIGIEAWLIAIENKIYATSVSSGQLTREYEGLKNIHSDAKIGMVYLVPVDEDSDILDGKTEREFEDLAVRDDDFKVITTWQKNSIDKVPSVSEIISRILDEENRGLIDPVSEYTRHTLKAFVAFISNDFSGCEYERESHASGTNPLTEAKLSIDELAHKIQGYVGVKGAIRGLLKMDRSAIRSYKFQYTSQDMSVKPYWIEIGTFNKIISWILYDKIDDIDWKGRLPSAYLFAIAKDFRSKVFVGIRGGENALKKLPNDEIKNRDWSISREQSSSQWIDGELFFNIIKAKHVF